MATELTEKRESEEIIMSEYPLYDSSYARYIDHTILKMEATRETIRRFCDEAKEYGFASVCVNGGNAAFVSEQLKGSGVKTCVVVGFPLGANSTAAKVAESLDAIGNGAEEIDMVMNVGALKDGDCERVLQDIRGVVEACHPDALVKVIIETSALTDEEKRTASRLCVEAGADFVKTSTGFGTGGATVEDIRLIKEVVGDKCRIKASTGINDRRICDAMLQAGAVRMGTSKGIRIVRGE